MATQDTDEPSALAPTVDDGLTAEERDSEADRIKVNQLHAAILYTAKRSLEDGILIGEVLAKRKAKCGHGNWLPWLNANVEFTAVTAGNYIRLFENAEWLKSKNVFDLTDARLKLREKSKAEGAKPRGRGAAKPPKQRSRDLERKAIEIFRERFGAEHLLRGGGLTLLPVALEFVNKVPVTKGETNLTIGEEAFRLWEASLSPEPTLQLKEPDRSPTEDPTDVQETPENLWTEPTTTIVRNLEEAPEDNPAEPPEAPTDDSDDSSPTEPLVTVEQTEEFKRQGYVEEGDVWQIRRGPKPYYLIINRPQNELGWLAAHDQLFLDGPTYTSQYDVLKQLRASLITPPFFDEELDKPETPDGHTCFDEYRRLMAQWVFKLPKDELDKLRKLIHRTSNPKYWEQFAKDLKGD